MWSHYYWWMADAVKNEQHWPKSHLCVWSLPLSSLSLLPTLINTPTIVIKKREDQIQQRKPNDVSGSDIWSWLDLPLIQILEYSIPPLRVGFGLGFSNLLFPVQIDDRGHGHVAGLLRGSHGLSVSKGREGGSKEAWVRAPRLPVIYKYIVLDQMTYRVFFFFTGPPPKSSEYRKVDLG